MATLSCETIIGIARDLARKEGSTDVPAFQDSFLYKAITSIDYELLRAFRQGGGNTPPVRAAETGYTLITDTATAEAVTSATTDFDVDSSSSFSTSGALVLWDTEMFDICFFTGNSSNNFTGVTGIAFNHAIDTGVQALYALPSNFKKFRRSEEYGDGVRLNGSPLLYMDAPPRPGYFSLVDDGTTKYLWVFRGASGKIGAIYDKNISTIDSLDDLVSFDDEYQFFYAWRCIEMGLFGEDINLMQLAKQKGDMEKLNLLKARNVGRRIKVRPLHDIANIVDHHIPYIEVNG